jgi:hypothetical protein
VIVIHLIDPQPSLKAAARQLARVISRKVKTSGGADRFYRDRLHYVAANQNGTYTVALEGTDVAKQIAANPGLMIGSYFTTRDEAALADRLLEDLTA